MYYNKKYHCKNNKTKQAEREKVNNTILRRKTTHNKTAMRKNEKKSKFSLKIFLSFHLNVELKIASRHISKI